MNSYTLHFWLCDLLIFMFLGIWVGVMGTIDRIGGPYSRDLGSTGCDGPYIEPPLQSVIIVYLRPLPHPFPHSIVLKAFPIIITLWPTDRYCCFVDSPPILSQKSLVLHQERSWSYISVDPYVHMLTCFN